MTIEDLKNYGANVEEGLGRCMKNEALYLRLVKMSMDETYFKQLGEHLAARDLGGAFEVAHALKGTLGNLSLTPLYEPVCKLSDQLKKPSPEDDYDSLYKEIMEQFQKLQELEKK